MNYRERKRKNLIFLEGRNFKLPTYSFRNKETNEVSSKFMSIRDYIEFVKDHDELETVILSAPEIGDSVRLGIRKPDDSFREVLHKIAESNPKSNLKDKLSRN